MDAPQVAACEAALAGGDADLSFAYIGRVDETERGALGGVEGQQHRAAFGLFGQLGQEAAIKRLYAIDPASVEFVPAGSELPLLEKTLLRDILPGRAA